MRLNKAAVIAVAIALSLSTSVLAPPSHAAVSANVSFDFFYSNLSPYGSWAVSADYGRVWRPSNYASDWNPYYDGHWAYADLGWTWVSDYEWGAIPYHYGTWVPDPRLGWVWVPGYTWAPAWVVFRTGPDYIGWAPVAPSFSVGVSFGAQAPVSGSFLFVSTRDFCAPRIRTLVVPEVQARTIVNRTTIVNNLVVQNNIVVNRGPDVRAIETASRRQIPVTQVESLPRVAPFANVRREELTIAPDRARQHVRAAEPASASSPIPQGKDVAQLNRGSSHGNPRALPPSNETVAPPAAPAPPAPAREHQRATPPAAPAPAREHQRAAPPAPPAPAPQQSGAVEKKPSNDAKPSKPQDTKRQAPKKKAPEKSDEKQNGGHNDTP